jgi:hypothetical protein
MNKKYYFLCGMPRAGNTLFASLMNQIEDVTVTGLSILPLILFNIQIIRDHETFRNFPDLKSLNNICDNLFHNYYKDFNTQHIIDRQNWGTPFNLSYLKHNFKDRKFIVLHRPILESLASFIKIENLEDEDKIKIRCENLLDTNSAMKNGIIGKHLWSIENLIKEKEKIIILKYDDFLFNTQKNIDDVCDFLNIKKHKINKDNIEQLTINEIEYDDSVYGVNLHNLKTKLETKKKYKIEDYLSKEIINKYQSINDTFEELIFKHYIY